MHTITAGRGYLGQVHSGSNHRFHDRLHLGLYLDRGDKWRSSRSCSRRPGDHRRHRSSLNRHCGRLGGDSHGDRCSWDGRCHSSPIRQCRGSGSPRRRASLWSCVRGRCLPHTWVQTALVTFQPDVSCASMQPRTITSCVQLNIYLYQRDPPRCSPHVRRIAH